MMKNFDNTQPIILGLAGKAATGKTSVAEYLVPKAQINSSSTDVVWDHIFFALPLYEMVSAKLNIQGLRERERQLYALHSVIYDLFGGTPIGAVPDYDKLINLVKSIHSLPIDDTGLKPRSFLQKAGDLCREVDENCFTKWAISKSKSLYRAYVNSIQDDASPFCVIISDVRFLNEAQAILEQPNGIVICYEASEEVRDSRILKRDKAMMSETQKNHISEQQMDLVKDLASLIIDTDNLSIAEQAAKTVEAVLNLVGANA